ncbi:MAG TPA: hypothetical protein P5544_06390 [Candidatus Nanopelagicales bacterium]|nr:hypothetical protein [Candidatus Nanopelagicales bacterium]
MPISQSDVGAWVVKGDSGHLWDYEAKARDEGWAGGTWVPMTWSLGDTYRNGLIAADDPIVLYVHGQGDAGIVQIGRVTSMSSRGVWDPKYVLDLDKGSQLRPFVHFDGLVLRKPVSRADLVAHLGQSELIRAPQMTNPTYFTPEEVDMLITLISAPDMRTFAWAMRPTTGTWP